jgi:hypothetical protein
MAYVESDSQEDATERENSRIEWLLGISIACLLAVAAIPGVQHVPNRELADVTVRGLEGLLLLARDEAIRSGDDHIVLFEVDAARGQLTNNQGAPVMALLIRDRDGDGRRSASEYVASVPVGSVGADGIGGLVEWGSVLATVAANGDAAGQISSPWSFGQAMGQPGRVRRLVFRANGVPHSFSAESGLRGPAGTGAGTVYLHSPTLDYAIVLSPWGDVNVQIWDPASETWQTASTH